MKFFVIVFLFVVFLFPHNYSNSNAEVIYYGKITSDNVCFFASPTKNNLSGLFYIPKSYFVKLLNDENDDFYYAKYKDIYGYVLKNEVTVMSGTPNNPYADAYFRVFSTQGLGLYNSPYSNENNKITQVPYLAQNLVFYGEILGEEVVPEKGASWYYCNYNSDNNYFGFVYSVFCDKLTAIEPNTEVFEIVNNPSFSESQNTQELSATSMVFIIIGVSLPCLIVIYLLLKPTLLKDKNISELKPKRKRRGDYYEYNDSDLN